MINKIKKWDQWLLLHKPLLWNSQLVWVLLTAGIMHLIFFIFGVLRVIHPASLQSNNVANSFFTEGFVFLGVIMSLIAIVLWCVRMFKHNALKQFYPVKKKHLFLQFLGFLVGFFALTSVYMSYSFGMYTSVSIKYPDAQVKKELQTLRYGGALLPQRLFHYEVDQACYPAPLDSLYRTSAEDKMVQGPRLQDAYNTYQFFSVKSYVVNVNGWDRTEYQDIGIDVQHLDDNKIRYFLKDEAVDVQDFVKTSRPSLYHQSRFYDTSSNDKYSSYDHSMDYESGFSFASKEIVAQSKWVHELLDHGGDKALITQMTDFLALANYYQIAHNLEPKHWLKIIDHPDYEVKELVYDSQRPYDRSVVSYTTDAEEINERNSYGSYYFDSDNFKDVYTTISSIKGDSFFSFSIHFFLWLSFGLSVLVFLFRVGDIKTLLFTIVAAGVIGIIFSLMGVFLLGFLDLDIGGAFVYWLILLGLLLSTLLREPVGSKLKNGVLIGLSLLSIVPVWWLLFVFVNEIQEGFCDDGELYSSCETILDTTYIPLVSISMWSLSLGTVYLLCRSIMRYRASVEG